MLRRGALRRKRRHDGWMCAKRIGKARDRSNRKNIDDGSAHWNVWRETVSAVRLSRKRVRRSDCGSVFVD